MLTWHRDTHDLFVDLHRCQNHPVIHAVKDVFFYPPCDGLFHNLLNECFGVCVQSHGLCAVVHNPSVSARLCTKCYLVRGCAQTVHLCAVVHKSDSLCAVVHKKAFVRGCAQIFSGFRSTGVKSGCLG